jgi:hypothetical protein
MTYSIRMPNRLNKHNATRTVFLGDRYHSKGEAGYAMSLEAERGAGEILSWERQVKLDLQINGKHITNYYMDFAVHVDANTVELREYKGYETGEWKLKWRILEATLFEIGERYYPGKDIRMVLVKHKSSWKPRR